MKDYYRHLDTTVSIFPYLESMLIDTIASSIIHSNPECDFCIYDCNNFNVKQGCAAIPYNRGLLGSNIDTFSSGLYRSRIISTTWEFLDTQCNT